MDILEKIIAHKKTEVESRSKLVSIAALEKQRSFDRDTLSLKAFIADETKTGIIAEFKRTSPSGGVINAGANAELVCSAYAQNGASGLSVLTDAQFFGGSSRNLEEARVNEIPILRKDFIIDEYQVIESKAMGADVILLIAACLTTARVKQLAALAKQLKMEVLLEIHNDLELEHICDDTDLVGVNNRDLRSFTVDINSSIALCRKLPEQMTKIAESGIRDVDTVKLLKQQGFDGFLIGSLFMNTKDPGEAFRIFAETLKA